MYTKIFGRKIHSPQTVLSRSADKGPLVRWNLQNKQNKRVSLSIIRLHVASPLREFVILSFFYSLSRFFPLLPSFWNRPNIEMCSRPIGNRAEERKWQGLVTRSDGIEASERDAEKKRKKRGQASVWRKLRSEDKCCQWSRASLSKRSVGRTQKKRASRYRTSSDESASSINHPK